MRRIRKKQWREYISRYLIDFLSLFISSVEASGGKIKYRKEKVTHSDKHTQKPEVQDMSVFGQYNDLIKLSGILSKDGYR